MQLFSTLSVSWLGSSIWIRSPVGALFKNIKLWFMKKFISLFMISSILQQYLLNVSSHLFENTFVAFIMKRPVVGVIIQFQCKNWVWKISIGSREVPWSFGSVSQILAHLYQYDFWFETQGSSWLFRMICVILIMMAPAQVCVILLILSCTL